MECSSKQACLNSFDSITWKGTISLRWKRIGLHHFHLESDEKRKYPEDPGLPRRSFSEDGLILSKRKYWIAIYKIQHVTASTLSSLKSIYISYFNDLFTCLWTSRKFLVGKGGATWKKRLFKILKSDKLGICEIELEKGNYTFLVGLEDRLYTHSRLVDGYYPYCIVKDQWGPLYFNLDDE